jgi:signal transduction histidine kinase
VASTQSRAVPYERLLEEQAALRRAAVLVASGADAHEVFSSLSEGAGRVCNAEWAGVLRIDGDTATVIGRWSGDGGDPVPLGMRIPLVEGAALTIVAATGRTARVDDYSQVRGPIADIVKALDVQAVVAAPIFVEDRLWGTLSILSFRGGRMATDTEERLTAFTELASLAVASIDARERLLESRARIVRTADDERRRIERNLHDGAQQHLVAIALLVRRARSRLEPTDSEAIALLERAEREFDAALHGLRELARGIHPAVLTEHGLGAALDALAARSAVPAQIRQCPSGRLPDPIEVAVYYTVAEALANVAKHAEATAATVSVSSLNGQVVVEVADDGVGGAAEGGGSGLRGLADRIEALGGALSVESPLRQGTRLRAQIPIA